MAEGTGLQNLWTKIPRQFESDSHLLQGEYMRKPTAEFIKNTIVIVVCLTTIFVLSAVLYTGRHNKIEPIESGNIAHAIETGQYSK